MKNQSKTIEINGIELEEGMTLWRLAGLKTYKKTINEQDPDEVLRETARQLVEGYPETVDVDEMPDNQDPVEIVHTNLRANPGIYDDTGLMRYHSMEVKAISQGQVRIKDQKEQKEYVFHSDEIDGPEYLNFEPMSALEEHLGVTILPPSDDDE